MLFKRKVEVSQIMIYNYDNIQQTMSLVYRGSSVPKKFKRSKKLWHGIDKKRKIETFIVLC